MDKYEDLLERAIDQLPPEVFEHKRFKIPKAYSDLNRDPQHLLKFLMRELGTAGNIEGQRAILQGKFTHYLINERIEDYVDKYVICHECNRPDTRIIREGRIFILKCAACGATAPLKSL